MLAGAAGTAARGGGRALGCGRGQLVWNVAGCVRWAWWGLRCGLLLVEVHQVCCSMLLYLKDRFRNQFYSVGDRLKRVQKVGQRTVEPVHERYVRAQRGLRAIDV